MIDGKPYLADPWLDEVEVLCLSLLKEQYFNVFVESSEKIMYK